MRRANGFDAQTSAVNTKDHPGIVAAARIAAADDRTRYDNVAIALHWAMALLVLTQFGLAELWDFAARPTKHVMIATHMTCGILLAAIVVTSLIWRFGFGHQVRPAAGGAVQATAKSVQFLLYALIATQAALGVVLRWSGKEAMSFFGLQIPPAIAPFSKSAHELVGDIHSYVGWTIIAVATAHTAAALFHHFALRDDVLWRMLPGREARRQEARAPSPQLAAARRRDTPERI